MLIPQRASDIPEELAERRKLLREYKGIDDFIAKSKEITEKFAEKVDKTIS